MSNLEVFNIRLAAWANDSRISQANITQMLQLLCSEESPLETDLEVLSDTFILYLTDIAH